MGLASAMKAIPPETNDSRRSELTSNDVDVQKEDPTIYRDRRFVSDISWTESEILYSASLKDMNIPLGECLSKSPFKLDLRDENPPIRNSYGDTPAHGRPALEVRSEIVANARVSNPYKLSQLSICTVSGATLHVHSPILMGVLTTLNNITMLFPGGIHESVLTFHEPYHYLLHCVPKLEQILENNNNEEKAEHIKLLLDYLQPYVQSQAASARIKAESCPENPVIDFDSIWYLFAPGTEVYVRDKRGGRLQGAIVRKYDCFDDSFELHLEYLVIGRNRLHSVPRLVHIAKFGGSLPIVELSCCPAAIMDSYDQGKLRNLCLQSTRKIFGLIASGHPEMHYDGPMLWYKENRGLVMDGYYTGSVVFDFHAMFDATLEAATKLGETMGCDSASELEPSAFEKSPLLAENWWNAGRQDRSTIERVLGCLPKAMTERHALMIGHRSVAYGLREKKWLAVDVDLLTEIQRLEDPLKNVIIPSEDIMLIKALSYQKPEAKKLWSVDFVPGKGIGKIVLLHGPPGVGKTYTVECIAEAFAMPLLSISIANVSLEEKWVERDLRTWFTLAERWNAILLLDEADVFLERRLPSDLERNALVAALLRLIEYYTGLLFLTTNRVGQIDDAFASRMHVVIGYSKINQSSRTKIWNAFFEKLDREQDGQIVVGENAREYVLNDPEVIEVNWNGREIRNALQTVIALAEFQAVQRQGKARKAPIIIEEAHFRQYMRMSQAYRKYTFNVAKEDEAKRALTRRERYDF